VLKINQRHYPKLSFRDILDRSERVLWNLQWCSLQLSRTRCGLSHGICIPSWSRGQWNAPEWTHRITIVSRLSRKNGWECRWNSDDIVQSYFSFQLPCQMGWHILSDLSIRSNTRATGR